MVIILIRHLISGCTQVKTNMLRFTRVKGTTVKIRVKIKSKRTENTPISVSATKKVTIRQCKVDTISPPISNGCPRRPSSPICGYGADKQHEGCNFPTGHFGLHGRVSSPEIVASIPRRELSACPVELQFENEILPQALTDIIYAWKKIGNPWASALEADLELFSKGYKFQNNIDDLNAVRALYYLEYMKKEDAGPGLNVARYKLSKKGLLAAARIAELIGEEDTQPIKDIDTETDCNLCAGWGVDDDGLVCHNCNGSGSAPKKRTRRTGKEIDTTISPPEKTVATCGRCNGACVLPSGKVCPKCDGTGEGIILGGNNGTTGKDKKVRIRVKRK
jgi:hypothetical protein